MNRPKSCKTLKKKKFELYLIEVEKGVDLTGFVV